MNSKLDNKLNTLLWKWGYTLEGKSLIQEGVKGYCSRQKLGNFNSVLSAVEYLIPIINDDDYSEQYHEIMKD
jgi:hypothetical protein